MVIFKLPKLITKTNIRKISKKENIGVLSEDVKMFMLLPTSKR